MGGVPLLMLATVTVISYGWQPSDDGGLDYIIQVSPDQVDEFRRGEISSVIDPAVQGRVTRVIVRVGTDPLPKILPSLAASDVRDQQNLPIPESKSVALMKPDPGTPGSGPSFQLPADIMQVAGTQGAGAPNAAQSAAGGVTQRAQDALKRMVNNAGDSGGNAAAAAANALRNSMNAKSPAAPRANLWEQANQSKAPATGQSPPFVGPPDPRRQMQVPRVAAADAQPNQRDNPILGGTSTFGKLPSGISPKGVAFPSTDPPSEMAAVGGQRQSAQVNPKLKGFNSTAAMSPADLEYQRKLLEYERQLEMQKSGNRNTREPLLTTTLQPPTARANPTSRSAQLNVPSLQMPGMGMPSFADTNAPMSQAQAQQPPLTSGTPRTDVDPRLSKADIDRLPYGAWSFDDLDNPIDRQGRILDRFGRPVSAQRAYELRYGKKQTQDVRPIQVAAQPNPNTNLIQPTAINTLPTRQTVGTNLAPNTVAVNRRSPAASPSDMRPSQINARDDERYAASGSVTTIPTKTTPNTVLALATLASLVANACLIAFLFSRREQYRTTIARKRAAADGLVG